MAIRPRSLAVLLTATLLLGACAGNATTSSQPSPEPSAATSQAGVPTAEQLAAALVTSDDIEGTWMVNVPPDASAAVSGVVTPEQQAMLPRIALCDKASSRSLAAAEALRWAAFRQLDQDEENPIDMSAGDRVGHMIFVQEYLTSGYPTEIETVFTALREGLKSCQGRIPAGQEGPGRTEPMTIPAVGDDRYGERTTIEEAGGGAYWLLYNSLVRKGPVLMELQVVDIVMGDGVEPAFTSQDIATILTTATQMLP